MRRVSFRSGAQQQLTENVSLICGYFMISRFGDLLFVLIINCEYNTSLVRCVVCSDEK